jgi:phage shock protein E
MSKSLKFVVAALIALFAVGSLAACASSNSIDMKSVSAVIDVRTPAEYAAGHLSGAMNIDVEATDFGAKIGQLNKTKNYVVYCHSGRRASIARDWMMQNGFTGTITNAGAIADAAKATGLSVVQ